MREFGRAKAKCRQGSFMPCPHLSTTVPTRPLSVSHAGFSRFRVFQFGCQLY